MPYTFADQLPDPNYRIDWYGSGGGTTGDLGPGFASVKLTNDQKMLVNRTNSQRVLARSVAAQKWKIDITYHPMTRAEFEPVYSFLLRQNGPLTPFFVSLPQYRVPQNAAWDAILKKTFIPVGGSATNLHAAHIKVATNTAAGSSEVMLNVGRHSGATSNDLAWDATGEDTDNPNVPRPGDMVTFSNHTKAYLITQVQTNTNYQDGSDRPTAASSGMGQIKIGVSPSFSETVPSTTIATFSLPKVKVIMPQPLGQYSLNTDNLYSFNLKLEEYL
tara:strand:+ start:707 stop:1528 length:822 start_codon:yes stop_codon:yes gene_type:complete